MYFMISYIWNLNQNNKRSNGKIQNFNFHTHLINFLWFVAKQHKYFYEIYFHLKSQKCRHLSYHWRASEASETLSGVYKFELVRYIYIYIYMYGGTYAIIVAHATHT